MKILLVTDAWAPQTNGVIGYSMSAVSRRKRTSNKNIESFLELPVDADKVIVGDGPHRDVRSRCPASPAAPSRWRTTGASWPNGSLPR